MTLLDVNESLVVSDHAHVAASGVEDVAIIAANDAIYAGRLSEAQKSGPHGQKRFALAKHENADGYPQYNSPPLGWLHIYSEWRALPGEETTRQTRHEAQFAQTSPASRALDCRTGCRGGTIEDSMTMLSKSQSICLSPGCDCRVRDLARAKLEFTEA